MPKDEHKYLNAINILASAKSGALQAVYDAFNGNWGKAWHANLTKYIPRDRDAQGKLVNVDFTKLRARINPDKAWTIIERGNMELMTALDKDYPEPLRHIADPPFLLYLRGSKDVFNGQCFGVVGTRALSEYGKRVTPHIVMDIARAGFTIVSGLAMGIDTLAHKTALENSAKTIAVLGTGIDDGTIFPAPNLGLARKIIEQGGIIVSEYAPGTHGTKFSFPQRNRIISGLSKGVLVVEADEQSGAMITARFAAEQGRDVFAIPGSIFARTSQGTNNVIKKGAKLVTCAEDILEEYESIFKNPAYAKASVGKAKIKIKADNETEEKILAILTDTPMATDDIIRQTGLNASRINTTLTMMELKKKVKNLDGKFILYS